MAMLGTVVFIESRALGEFLSCTFDQVHNSQMEEASVRVARLVMESGNRIPWAAASRRLAAG